MWPTHELYAAGIAAYALAAAGGLASHLLKKSGRGMLNLLCALALSGALAQFGASSASLLGGAEFEWSFPSGVPYLSYSVRLDPLSSYFNHSLPARPKNRTWLTAGPCAERASWRGF